MADAVDLEKLKTTQDSSAMDNTVSCINVKENSGNEESKNENKNEEWPWDQVPSQQPQLPEFEEKECPKRPTFPLFSRTVFARRRRE